MKKNILFAIFLAFLLSTNNLYKSSADITIGLETFFDIGIDVMEFEIPVCFQFNSEEVNAELDELRRRFLQLRCRSRLALSNRCQSLNERMDRLVYVLENCDFEEIETDSGTVNASRYTHPID